uniref:Uncharacterized protein n=1 Tax=Glossina pallidipes TaxID=7398 RepID=A0A1A9ZKI0_GLOPL
MSTFMRIHNNRLRNTQQFKSPAVATFSQRNRFLGNIPRRRYNRAARTEAFRAMSVTLSPALWLAGAYFYNHLISVNNLQFKNTQQPDHRAVTSLMECKHRFFSICSEDNYDESVDLNFDPSPLIADMNRAANEWYIVLYCDALANPTFMSKKIRFFALSIVAITDVWTITKYKYFRGASLLTCKEYEWRKEGKNDSNKKMQEKS